MNKCTNPSEAGFPTLGHGHVLWLQVDPALSQQRRQVVQCDCILAWFCSVAAVAFWVTPHVAFFGFDSRFESFS
ncbi:hypothetical protein JZ751_016894 [Albula glossodonta]|uniref:Uncharacterized protein n=1 Tax=Albula glossodonta TaxID=121402 RepID=A0A8T2MKC8_9TELE|nr:hypothetical protein JZ751_016894 [Albula glossodonta]